MQFSLAFSTFKVFGFLILFLGCNVRRQGDIEGSTYHSVERYFKEQHDFELLDNVTSLFVLTDNGCFSCNKQFAKFSSKFQDNPNSLFLIKASGAQVDLSSFSKKNKQVFYDISYDLENGIFKDSKVIFINNRGIDTIITLDAQLINEQFHEIGRRMDASER